MVENSVSAALSAIKEPDTEKISIIMENEKKVDKLTDEIYSYAIRLSAMDVSQTEHQKAVQILQIASDIERISDQCENISEAMEQIINDKTDIAPDSHNELIEMSELCLECLQCALSAYADSDADCYHKTIEKETIIDQMAVSFRSSNISRLAQNECDASIGIIFEDILINLERISDHARNIAEENWSHPLVWQK